MERLLCGSGYTWTYFQGAHFRGAFARVDWMWMDTQLITGPCDYQSLDFPPSGGAECVFIGRTRAESHDEFGALIRLEYEAYAPMVERKLREMAEAVGGQHGCLAVRLVHSQGPVALGEASVVIQVACGHRGESFDACRALIEGVKRELPVWKREVWERGETFVEGFKVQAQEPTDAR